MLIYQGVCAITCSKLIDFSVFSLTQLDSLLSKMTQLLAGQEQEKSATNRHAKGFFYTLKLKMTQLFWGMCKFQNFAKKFLTPK